MLSLSFQGVESTSTLPRLLRFLKIYNNPWTGFGKELSMNWKEFSQRMRMLSSVFPGTEKDTRGEITILFQDGQSYQYG